MGGAAWLASVLSWQVAFLFLLHTVPLGPVLGPRAAGLLTAAAAGLQALGVLCGGAAVLLTPQSHRGTFWSTRSFQQTCDALIAGPEHSTAPHPTFSCLQNQQHHAHQSRQPIKGATIQQDPRPGASISSNRSRRTSTAAR